MKLCTVVGARPQFIKAAAVSRIIALCSNVTESIIHTGQHYDVNMSDVFFDELDIPRPDYNLGIGGGSHGQNTGRMIEGIEQVLMKEKPDWLLVYGDTDSTLAGAIAAAKLHIPIAHVEAGLRSFNRLMPEEINRIITDHTSNLLFTPTNNATKNLKSEGIEGRKVAQVGDVMQDAALFYHDKAQNIPGLVYRNGFILCTIHRAENTNDIARLISICSALNTIAENTQVILPLHPRTRKIITTVPCDLSKLTLIDPVGYLKMVWLLKECGMVVTDSGGLQKEAFFFNKPCVTIRDQTEWVELVDLGVNKLAGPDKVEIVSAVQEMQCKRIVDKYELYGGGNAANRIVEMLL